VGNWIAPWLKAAGSARLQIFPRICTWNAGYFQIQLNSGRSLRLRRLSKVRASLVEEVDVVPGIRGSRFRSGPCEADFKRGKQNAVDDDRFLIRQLDPGVPQTCSCLEKFDSEAAIVHGVTPDVPESKQA
jgi:hypothetical protein